MMDSRISRGAVAAILGFGVALPLRAQGAPVPVKVIDTNGVRIVMSGRRIPLDSIAVLMRAFDQEPLGSQEMLRLRDKIDRMTNEMATTNRVTFGDVGREMKLTMLPKGWIGISLSGPRMQFIDPSGLSEEYVDYQSIVSVDPESPAQRAGVAPGDVLVAYNGIDLKGHRFNLTHMFAPDEKLSVTVRREGETKDFSMVVAKTPQQVIMRRRDLDALPEGDIRVAGTLRASPAMHNGNPGGTLMITTQPNAEGNFTFRVMPTQNGVFGARVLTLSPELAKKLKLSAGLLVDEVPEETPAFKSGLRTGDVIVSAAGQPVSSIKRLLELLMLRDTDRRAALVVMRDGKPHPISVSW